jgi:hypothetical protein
LEQVKAAPRCSTIDSVHVCRIWPKSRSRVNATPTSTASSASGLFSPNSKFFTSNLATKDWLAIAGNQYRVSFCFENCAQEFAAGFVVVCDENIHAGLKKKLLW